MLMLRDLVLVLPMAVGLTLLFMPPGSFAFKAEQQMTVTIPVNEQWTLTHKVDTGQAGSPIPDPQLIDHEFLMGTFRGSLECTRFAKALASYGVVDRQKAGDLVQALASPEIGYTVFELGGKWTRTRLLCQPAR